MSAETQEHGECWDDLWDAPNSRIAAWFAGLYLCVGGFAVVFLFAALWGLAVTVVGIVLLLWGCGP